MATESVTPRPSGANHRRRAGLILATGLAIAVYGMQATLLGTLLPELSKTLTPGQSGTIATAQSLGLILASLGTGPAIDHLGARAGILSGLGLLALALLLLPGAHGFLSLTLVMALLGTGGGVISTTTNTMASCLGGSRPASMMNLLNVFFGLGGLATPALGAFLNRASLSRAITLLALITLALHALLPPIPQSAQRGFRDAAARRRLIHPLFLLLALFLFLYVAAELGVWNWLATYLVLKGMPKEQALLLLSFGFAPGIIVGRIVAARLLLRFRSANVTLACSALMACATGALLLASGPWSAGIAVFCAGLFMAPVYPTTLSLVGQTFPQGTATAIGIAVTTGWVGVAVTSRVIGGIAGSDPGRLGYALLVIPGCAVLMFLVNLVFRRLLPPSAIPA